MPPPRLTVQLVRLPSQVRLFDGGFREAQTQVCQRGSGKMHEVPELLKIFLDELKWQILNAKLYLSVSFCLFLLPAP